MMATMWLILGLILMGTELITPGFVLFFFGLSALTVGGVVYFFPLEVLWQVLLFAALSVVYLLALRRIFKRTFTGRTGDARQAFDDFAGQMAVVTQPIAENALGKVEFRGAAWTAAADMPIAAGTRVRIERKESLTLFVSDKL